MKKPNLNPDLFSRVGFLAKLLLTKHLNVLIKSGIPVSESIQILIDQSRSSGLRKILQRISDDVKNGQSLADSLAEHPKVFDPFYISLITVGEESGTLEENLAYLAEQLDKDYSLRKKVQAALLYPGIVITSTLIMGSFISFFILPKLLDFFSSFDADLPPITKALLWFAALMQNYGLYILVGLVASIIGLLLLLRLPPVKLVWQRLILTTPIVGQIIINSNLARFSRNLGVMLRAGLPINRAFEVTSATLDNVYFVHLLTQGQADVEAGKQLNAILSGKRYQIFPPITTKMIGVGEKTGKLDETLIYLAGFYEEELDSLSQNLTTVLEPLLLIAIGLVVGFVALAIISPIYDLTSAINQP